MAVIYGKEMRQYFVTPVGVVFLAAYFAFTGYYFTVGCLLPASADLSGLFGSVFSVLMVLVPLLTMRSFAEEQRQKTDILIFSSPISPGKVLAGKFLSALTVFLLGSLSLVPPVCILARFGALNLSETLGNFTALLLIGAAYVAIGLFASSLTENQIVAALLSYAVTLGLWLIDYLRYYTESRFLRSVISYISLRAHFGELSSGVFSLSMVVYLLSLQGLMLALTYLVLEHKREK